MMSAELPNVNPIPAAAQPEYELSIEITTGMAAPPIGMMMRTPDRNDASVSSQNAAYLSVRTNHTVSSTIASASAMLMTCRIGSMIGAPLMRADSFINA